MASTTLAESRRELADSGRPGEERWTLLPLKTALFLGFGLTVGIWVFAGVYFGGRITMLDERTTAVSERYVHAQRLLHEARTNVLLSSVHLRDTLLNTDPVSSSAARDAMTSALEAAADSLSRYVPILNSPVEQARVERLLGEIVGLRRTMLDMLAIGTEQLPVMAGPLLQERLAPRRQVFINLAEDLGTLNRTAFVAHQVEMVGLYRDAQQQVWQVLGLALVASLGVALVSTFYAGRLERQIRKQRARDGDMQRGLQRLSAELIRVREQERRAIARELHDGIGQLLTAAKFELAAAQNAIDERGGPRDLLDDARPIVERALQAVRDLSHVLHPAVLDDLGLLAAVDLHIKEFRRRHPIGVDLTETGMDDRLPRDVETAAYRIVQEALTNVAKHAGATSCRVNLVRLSRGLVVVVGDDGKGFDPNDERTSGVGRGLGLVSMRERAAQLGGHLVVESASGRGTRIVVELPVSKSRTEAEYAEDLPE